MIYTAVIKDRRLDFFVNFSLVMSILLNWFVSLTVLIAIITGTTLWKLSTTILRKICIYFCYLLKSNKKYRIEILRLIGFFDEFDVIIEN